MDYNSFLSYDDLNSEFSLPEATVKKYAARFFARLEYLDQQEKTIVLEKFGQQYSQDNSHTDHVKSTRLHGPTQVPCTRLLSACPRRVLTVKCTARKRHSRWFQLKLQLLLFSFIQITLFIKTKKTTLKESTHDTCQNPV